MLAEPLRGAGVSAGALVADLLEFLQVPFHRLLVLKLVNLRLGRDILVESESSTIIAETWLRASGRLRATAMVLLEGLHKPPKLVVLLAQLLGAEFLVLSVDFLKAH